VFKQSQSKLPGLKKVLAKLNFAETPLRNQPPPFKVPQLLGWHISLLPHQATRLKVVHKHK
jgi:hypothetical protein